MSPDPPQFVVERVGEIREEGLVICDPVYAEVRAGLPPGREMFAALNDFDIALERTSTEALDVAAERWLAYTESRPRNLTCTYCGVPARAVCQNCGRQISVRQHMIADFLIGAHALVHADQLLTRDRGYYRTYFPELKLAPL